MDNFSKILLSFLLTTLLAFTSWLGVNEYRDLKRITEIEMSLTSGLTNLAWDRLQKYRDQVKVSKKLCQYLTIASISAGEDKDIILEAERCFFSGFSDISFPYLALSTYYERKKDLDKSKKVLYTSLNNVKSNMPMFRRLISLYSKEKNKKMILDLYIAAAKSHPRDLKIQVDAISYLAMNEKWILAGELIPNLENVPHLNIQIQLLMARVVQKLGKEIKSKEYLAVIAKNMQRLDKVSQRKLKNKFRDVFSYHQQN